MKTATLTHSEMIDLKIYNLPKGGFFVLSSSPNGEVTVEKSSKGDVIRFVRRTNTETGYTINVFKKVKISNKY